MPLTAGTVSYTTVGDRVLRIAPCRNLLSLSVWWCVGWKDLTERGFKWKNDEGRMQHDAHELIRLLIDRLERDMKFSKVNAGLVSALYEGDLANQVSAKRWLALSQSYCCV